jgi:hypothetical protein
MSAAKEDVEMKDVSKEEVKPVEEPLDPYFGKSQPLNLSRVQKDHGANGESKQRKGLQAECLINQIIQKDEELLHSIRCCAHSIALPARPVEKTLAAMPAYSYYSSN